MSKYTKGPWRVRELVNGTLGIYAEGEYDIVFPKKSVIVDADAQLISAAPELYEALKELKMFYLTLSHMNPDAFIKLKEILPNTLIDKMEQAIKGVE